jgi:imidazoleglycerol-phosphate dehydratase/histidinol-phosphatase
MDDCLAQVAIDFGGRNWLVWDTEFKRVVGKTNRDVLHFFKSFSDGAKANINIKAEGQNEHHKIEAILRLSPKRSR